MNMHETVKLIKALRLEGWSGDDIDDLIIFLESSEENYAPRKAKQEKESNKISMDNSRV